MHIQNFWLNNRSFSSRIFKPESVYAKSQSPPTQQTPKVENLGPSNDQSPHFYMTGTKLCKIKMKSIIKYQMLKPINLSRQMYLVHPFLPHNIIARKRNCTTDNVSMLLANFTFSCFLTLHLLTAIESAEAPAETSKYQHGTPNQNDTKWNTFQTSNACKLLICCKEYFSRTHHSACIRIIIASMICLTALTRSKDLFISSTIQILKPLIK